MLVASPDRSAAGDLHDHLPELPLPVTYLTYSCQRPPKPIQLLGLSLKSRGPDWPVGLLLMAVAGGRSSLRRRNGGWVARSQGGIDGGRLP